MAPGRAAACGDGPAGRARRRGAELSALHTSCGPLGTLCRLPRSPARCRKAPIWRTGASVGGNARVCHASPGVAWRSSPDRPRPSDHSQHTQPPVRNRLAPADAGSQPLASCSSHVLSLVSSQRSCQARVDSSDRSQALQLRQAKRRVQSGGGGGRQRRRRQRQAAAAEPPPHQFASQDGIGVQGVWVRPGVWMRAGQALHAGACPASLPAACAPLPAACARSPGPSLPSLRLLDIPQVGLLTLKTAAKPLAKQFERVIMGHPVARQRVISMAQVRPVCRAAAAAVAYGRPRAKPSSRRGRLLSPQSARRPPGPPVPRAHPRARPAVAAPPGGRHLAGGGGAHRARVCGRHERGEGAGAGVQGGLRGLPVRGERGWAPLECRAVQPEGASGSEQRAAAARCRVRGRARLAWRHGTALARRCCRYGRRRRCCALSPAAAAVAARSRPPPPPLLRALARHRPPLSLGPPARPSRPPRPQVGIGVVGAELYRKNQEDLVKKEKEAAEKEAMRDLHERHLAAERVRVGAAWAG